MGVKFKPYKTKLTVIKCLCKEERYQVKPESGRNCDNSGIASDAGVKILFTLWGLFLFTSQWSHPCN